MRFITQLKSKLNPGDNSIPLLLFVCSSFILGCYLRLWNISSQVFLDDEWHAVNFVLERSFREVVFQHGMGANSIPINIWFWLTLHTIGWSEVILKLPSIASGILSLALLPYLVNKLWGRFVSLSFLFLLSISPVVIFYCRVSRPFSSAMFLGASSVLFSILWMRDKKTRDLYLASVLGFLSYYFHLYSVIPVSLSLIVATVSVYICNRKQNVSVNGNYQYKHIISALLIIVTLTSIFIIYPNLTNPWWSKVQGISKSNINTLVTFTEFIVGSAQYNLSASAFILLPLGCFLLAKRDKGQGAALTLPIIIFALIIATYTQDGAHAGIQAARYGIVLFPLFFILIAISCEWILLKVQLYVPTLNKPWSLLVLFLLLWAPFMCTSPLITIYNSPNNFTNHSGYQYHYSPISWDNSPERELVKGISVNYTEIPQIYRMPQLYSRHKGIIEYPMVIGDHFNLLYYYQHFHKLPVIIGYTKTDFSPKSPPRAEWVYGNRTVDYIMASVPQKLADRTMAWKTMINIEQPEALRKYSGWLLILHKNPCREVTEHLYEFDMTTNVPSDLPTSGATIEYLTNNLGRPIMQTNHVVAWTIK